jgi:hypothetical protein
LDAAIEAVDVNSGIYHAFVHMWRVETCDPEHQVVMFNPKYNLDNAAADAVGLLFDLALANRVVSTREKLCNLSCDLMIRRPNWSVIRDHTLSHLTLCKDCEHNMQHHYESFTQLSEHDREHIRKMIEEAHKECTIDPSGAIVLKHP